jgi:TIR domain-containing protein
MPRHYLFSESQIFDVMSERQHKLRDAFKYLDASALADANLSERLAAEYGLEIPLLDEDNKYATTREADIDVSRDHRRFISDRSRPFLIRGTEITIHVPFSGDASLFEVRPAQFNLNPPAGSVNGKELQFVYEITDERDITPEFETDQHAVKQHLDWLRNSGPQLKAQLKQLANSLLDERKRRAEAQSSALGKLNIPIRQIAAEPVISSPNPARIRDATQKDGRKQSEHEWDVFISHASEDKEAIARPLAEALVNAGLKVWYDDFSLKLGDSLRQSIDRGLGHSRYGVVILSPHFFEKHWPQQELNGLATREVNGYKVILPVWHNIGFEQVRAFSPMLADRLAVNASKGLDEVVRTILDAMR